MPIYEYRCSECNHQLEVIQKLSEPVLTECPACGKPGLVKLVSAAGFQLKGSGWYQTDFRDGGKKKTDGGGSEGGGGSGEKKAHSCGGGTCGCAH